MGARQERKNTCVWRDVFSCGVRAGGGAETTCFAWDKNYQPVRGGVENAVRLKRLGWGGGKIRGDIWGTGVRLGMYVGGGREGCAAEVIHEALEGSERGFVVSRTSRENPGGRLERR